MLNTTVKTISIISLIIVSGCTTLQTKQQTVTPAPAKPSYMMQGSFERQHINREPESLSGIWSEAGPNDFFQDHRAYRVGDIVTVNVAETSSASKSATTSTGKSTSIDAGINSLLGWEGRLKNLTSFGKSDVRNAYDSSNMLSGSLSNSFSGSGSTTRGDSMTASVTVRVIDVKPNGNLVIQGAREISVNSESQGIMLSGEIRPVDISPDNTILSSYIANLRIEYIGSGSISDKQQPGWLVRLVDTVWPF